MRETITRVTKRMIEKGSVNIPPLLLVVFRGKESFQRDNE